MSPSAARAATACSSAGEGMALSVTTNTLARRCCTVMPSRSGLTVAHGGIVQRGRLQLGRRRGALDPVLVGDGEVDDHGEDGAEEQDARAERAQSGAAFTAVRSQEVADVGAQR